MVWYGMVWYGMVWYGMVWYGMVWYGMVWYGIPVVSHLLTSIWGTGGFTFTDFFWDLRSREIVFSIFLVRYGIMWFGVVWYDVR
jgi:chloride channel 2